MLVGGLPSAVTSQIHPFCSLLSAGLPSSLPTLPSSPAPPPQPTVPPPPSPPPREKEAVSFVAPPSSPPLGSRGAKIRPDAAPPADFGGCSLTASSFGDDELRRYSSCKPPRLCCF
ncbi:hypothetical protein ZWY2020_036003 [Hordeum vulgare]|nr:hypothetical protein ZWY2020_036003 [Hordeum vulgare]